MVLYGNIKNLLSRSCRYRRLQNIHLTSQNAVLEEALIKNAVIQYVSVGDLQAGTILTSKFTIMDPDGGLLIKGPTAQWSDKNGNVRIQIVRMPGRILHFLYLMRLVLVYLLIQPESRKKPLLTV